MSGDFKGDFRRGGVIQRPRPFVTPAPGLPIVPHKDLPTHDVHIVITNTKTNRGDAPEGVN